MGLTALDWAIIGVYFLFVFAAGLYYKKAASLNKESYFLAGRSLPWWLAGVSIAATTFAADTPLAVAGIIAAKGISGNWLWFAWIGAHAGVIVLFSRYWSRAGTLTDAELIEMRYSGKAAAFLRLFRSGLSGVIMNCIVMGWVIRAMIKISSQFFSWDTIFPSFYTFLSGYWPAGTGLGSPSDGITLVFLILLVAAYSSLGGLRGVVFTDLFQFGIALIGSIWFAFQVWNGVGGKDKLQQGFQELYGANHGYFDLFPSVSSGWLGAMEVSAGVFAIYLFVQSFSNINVDGGGYMMQRLNAAKSEKDARLAALTFVVIHYLVRVWPWFVVGLCALVLIPLGQEGVMGDDRELAYPFLMREYLSPGVLGVVLASLLAAFMSTIDTHINWGASYIVNDWYLRFFPNSSAAKQIQIARLSVVGFAVLAILISFQINTVEQGWKWIAAIGASLGIPSLLRWLWWRVNAIGEITAMACGLVAAIVLFNFSTAAYEINLIIISMMSFSGLLIGIVLSKPTETAKLEEFQRVVRPAGVWLNSRVFPAKELFGWFAIVLFVVGVLKLGLWILFQS